MTPNTPRRFHSGGIVRGPQLKPGEIPALITPRHHADELPPALNFAAIDDLGLGAEGAAIMARIIDSAMLEATARAVTLGLVREFGVTLPLKAFRKRPKPLPRLEALVLEKLEGIAVHLGTP